MHGSVTHNLRWETDIEHVQYDPLVVTFAEGLVETRHPYHFVARKGLKDLLTANGAGARTVPLVHRLIRPIRVSLLKLCLLSLSESQNIKKSTPLPPPPLSFHLPVLFVLVLVFGFPPF